MPNTNTTVIKLSKNVRCLWAKSNPRHPLWKHLLDAAAVSLALHSPVTDLSWTPEATALLVGLHDIGKADAFFQHQVSDFSSELIDSGFNLTGDSRCRHERLSAFFIKNILKKGVTDSIAADVIARCVVVHHGYWYETGREVEKNYQIAQDELCRMLQSALGLITFPCTQPENFSAFGMRLSGHIVLCDWIASNEEFFGDPLLQSNGDPGDYFNKVQQVAREWISKLGLDRNQQEGKPLCIVKDPRPIQQTLLNEDIPPGLVIIEAPMGEGKTEAAWILAEKWRNKGYQGMYMALPTMATSDSLYERYRTDYLGKLGNAVNSRLVHGMAWLRDDLEPQKPWLVGEEEDDGSLAGAWFRPTRRAMLAAHGVGTVDQAMLAGMNVKFGFLRLYGLNDRVLVIDEVHAYDAYMSAIISRLLQWCACMKIPVILLSATLSASQRSVMLEAYGSTGGDPGLSAPYPLITVAEPGKEARTIKACASSSRILKLENHPGLLGDALKTAALATDLVKDGGCCCVILNTVKQAQAVYQALKLPENEKLLFHARFTAQDRESITNKVLRKFGKDRRSRPKKHILVATQVVEQSLDVDFDHMISEIAPIDLLLQRSGRLHRHEERNDETVLQILLPKQEENKPPKLAASEKIYSRYPLMRTLDILQGKKMIELPKEFRSLVENVYGVALPANASDDLKDSRRKWEDLQDDLAAQAGEFLLCEPMEDEFDPVGADEVGDDSDDGNGWRARTRLGMEDVLVIPVEVDTGELESLQMGEVTKEKAKELYLRSVKVPPYNWPLKSAKRNEQATPGKKKLRGTWLLPVHKTNGGWWWEGITDKRKPYHINYDREIGLTHGGE